MIAEAKDALLRALDQLEQAEADLDGPVDRVDLVVIYSLGRRAVEDDGAWHEVRGWSSTAGAKWTHAALLQRAADALDDADVAVDGD